MLEGFKSRFSRGDNGDDMHVEETSHPASNEDISIVIDTDQNTQYISDPSLAEEYFINGISNNVGEIITFIGNRDEADDPVFLYLDDEGIPEPKNEPVDESFYE